MRFLGGGTVLALTPAGRQTVTLTLKIALLELVTQSRIDELGGEQLIAIDV